MFSDQIWSFSVFRVSRFKIDFWTFQAFVASVSLGRAGGILAHQDFRNHFNDNNSVRHVPTKRLSEFG